MNIFFDKSIIIDTEKLPKNLQYAYSELKKIYEQNDEVAYSNYEEFFEATVKQAYIDGKISKKIVDDLFHIIGIF